MVFMGAHIVVFPGIASNVSGMLFFFFFLLVCFVVLFVISYFS